jgi:hypothetical protein
MANHIPQRPRARLSTRTCMGLECTMLLLTNNLQEECAAHASAEDGQRMVLASPIHYIVLLDKV